MSKVIVGLGGKCLDIQGAVNTDGTPIILYSRHNGLNQQWELTGDRFLVSPFAPGKCLDVEGGVANNGARIILWNKHGGKNQKWTHNCDGTLTCDLDSGKCIDVAGGIDMDGTSVILWEKNGQENQKWSFVPVVRPPYSTNVNFVPLHGINNPSATARLWMLESHVGAGTGSGAQPQELDTVSFRVCTNPVPVDFLARGPGSGSHWPIGLSIQEAGGGGWYFRSEAFPSLPALQIEVVFDEQPTVIPGDQLIPWMLPSAPFAIVPGILVSGFTATLVDKGIAFTATGTKPGLFTTIPFTYSGTFVLTPSAMPLRTDKAIDVGIEDISLTLPPLAVEPDLENNLKTYFLDTLGNKLGTNIELRVKAAIVSAAGRQLPGNGLPAGVILSVRRILTTAAGISVKGSLGAFGGVFSKFPPPPPPPLPPRTHTTPLPPPPPGKKCFIATAVHGSDSIEVAVLRTFRDQCLSENSFGRAFISQYERLSPPLAAAIAQSKVLKSVARRLIVFPAFLVAKISLALRSARRSR